MVWLCSFKWNIEKEDNLDTWCNCGELVEVKALGVSALDDASRLMYIDAFGMMNLATEENVTVL